MNVPRFFRAYASTPVGDLNEPQGGEAGAEGINAWYGQYLSGGPDVNPQLSGRAKFAVYDEMRKTDATVKSMLLLLKLPIRSANWGLNPRSEDPQDVAIRDFVADNLGLEGKDGWLDMSWDETLQQALTMLDFGVAFEEMVWGDVREWTDAQGQSRLVRPLERLAPRPVVSLNTVKRERGQIVEVTQIIPGTHPIPGEKLTYMVWEREADRWEGVSVLRAVWGPWKLKRELMVAAGIGWDRFAAGIPVVYHPNDPDSKAIAEAMGSNIRNHERASVTIPKERGQTKQEADYEIDLLNGAQTLPDPTDLLRFYSEQIAEGGLQQFIRQGLGKTGARATAEVQVDPYFLALQTIAEYVRQSRSRQVIKRLVEVNFGAEAAEKQTPLLTCSKLQARNILVIAQAAAFLADAGITFTDRGAVDDFRDLIGAPPLPEDLQEFGIQPEQLQAALQKAGVDPETLQRVIAELPPEIGVKRNRVEGAGLPAAA